MNVWVGGATNVIAKLRASDGTILNQFTIGVHDRGHYIHPELYGAPEQQSIGWARHPEVMKRMQQNRARQLAAALEPATATRADPPPIMPPSAPR